MVGVFGHALILETLALGGVLDSDPPKSIAPEAGRPSPAYERTKSRSRAPSDPTLKDVMRYMGSVSVPSVRAAHIVCLLIDLRDI